MRKLYSQAEIDEWRRYADSLAPGSYEQECVKLSIAMHECVNEVFAPFAEAGWSVLDFVLLVKVAGLLVAIRTTWRALVALLIRVFGRKR